MAEEYRNKKIGSKLWNTLMEYLENTNHKKNMTLTVFYGNQIASFYVDRGFRLASQNEIAIYRGFFCFANFKLVTNNLKIYLKEYKIIFFHYRMPPRGNLQILSFFPKY